VQSTTILEDDDDIYVEPRDRTTSSNDAAVNFLINTYGTGGRGQITKTFKREIVGAQSNLNG